MKLLRIYEKIYVNAVVILTSSGLDCVSLWQRERWVYANRELWLFQLVRAKWFSATESFRHNNFSLFLSAFHVFYAIFGFPNAPCVQQSFARLLCVSSSTKANACFVYEEVTYDTHFMVFAREKKKMSHSFLIVMPTDLLCCGVCFFRSINIPKTYCSHLFQ